MPKRAYSVASSTSDGEDGGSSYGPQSPAPANKRRNVGAKPNTCSSSSTSDAKETRKLARKERNRISAQLSRDRKKVEKESLESRLQDAEDRVQELTEENRQLREQAGKNKDMEEELERLKERFTQLERMMLGRVVENSGQQQAVPSLDSTTVTAAVKKEEEKVEQESVADVTATPTPTITAQTQQDSRIGSETHALADLFNDPGAVVDFGSVLGPFQLPPPNPSTTNTDNLNSSLLIQPQSLTTQQLSSSDIANLLQNFQSYISTTAAAPAALEAPAGPSAHPTSSVVPSATQASTSASTLFTPADPFHFLNDDHLLLPSPSFPSVPQQDEGNLHQPTVDGGSNSSSKSDDEETIDEDILSSFLLDQDLFSDSNDTMTNSSSPEDDPHEASTPEKDLLFGFTYESLVNHVHGTTGGQHFDLDNSLMV